MYRPLKDDAEAAAGWRCHFLSQDQTVPLKFRGEVGAKSEGASSLKKASGDIAKAKKAPCRVCPIPRAFNLLPLCAFDIATALSKNHRILS